jgi:uncharacterized membrane protein YphA (DoxX/SURF4 family)
MISPFHRRPIGVDRRSWIRPRPLAVSLAAIVVSAEAAGAHEKWFYDATALPTRWETAIRLPAVAGVAVAVALTIAAWLVWRARGGRDLIPGPERLGATEEGRTRFYALVPFIVGIHIALPLIALGIQGDLFSPNNELRGAFRYWFGVTQIGVGVSVLYGALTRLAGLVLAGLWLAGIGVVGLEPMLENVHVLAFAAFFVMAGRGPYAVDRLLFPALEPPPRLTRKAMTVVRVGTGLSLIVVAFTEKLANQPLAVEFLKKYPLNFTGWIGLPMSDDLFAVCAGTTELVIGLWLMLGLFPRVIIVTAWLFINMTLTLFNWVELLGHLPLYGVLSVLLVWTPGGANRRLWVRGVLGADRDAGTSRRA